MKVATAFSANKQPRTARTWAIRGYTVNDGETGEEMWTNGMRKVKGIYFMPDQVHQATDAELDAFWKPIKAAKSARAKELRKMKREKIERDIAPMTDFLNAHQDSDDELIKAICTASRFAVREYRRLKGTVPLYSLFKVEYPSADCKAVHSTSITLDTETTGLYPSEEAEILQLSIINQDGDVLINEYFKPIFAQTWERAMSVNHITPEMVADKPCIYERLPEILAILQGADRVIGYNTQFDLSMLEAVGAMLPTDTPVVDVMEDFAPIYGLYKNGCYRWQKLTTCAAYYGYDWGDDTAHDSLADCRATLFCYQKMQELPFAEEEKL